ncbi:glycosyltransferase family 4 protein [Stenotrophomonas sp. ATs4]|uniref:glycosyltransferase family 4 protein n=1 Tax=Stenotrophomonas sp. ATs4 TaxID=3402766 RepID=UPI003F6F1C85
MTHYRVPFFNALRDHLSSSGISLNVVFGDPTTAEKRKNDSGRLPWAQHSKCSYFFGDRLCWQPFLSQARKSDLVIVTHENKMLLNLLAQYGLPDKRVALWGHGANLQGSSGTIREAFKRRTADRADWWFGYTEMSLPLILASGFPADRVTIVENSIDTLALAREFAEATDKTSTRPARKLPLGAYIGSLYQEKRIDFLLQAAERVKARVPDFCMVIAGAGPEQQKVEQFSSANPWLSYVGTIDTKEKATLLARSRVLLNPGLVGLGILDSFVCRTPLVTTDCGLHSPEISYLRNGHNGVMTADNLDGFADEVVRLISDQEHHSRLVDGCIESSSRYTIQNMAERFSNGIKACLDANIRRGSR